MVQRSFLTSALSSMCVIAFFLLSASTVNAANSVINYSTSNGTVTAPQGYFYDASGKRISITNSTTTTLKFDGVVTTIGSYAFHNCSGLKTLTLPNSVTSVGYFAFSNCKTLSSPIYNTIIFARLPEDYQNSYEIPEGIKEIASAAFRNCDKLPSVTIPNSVKTISESAFAYCSSLTTLTIPGSVSTIDEYAFQSCTGLTSLYVGKTPATVAATTFNNIDKSKCILYVPTGCKSTYSNKSIWKEFTNIKEYSTTDGEDNNTTEYTGNVVLSDAAAYTNSETIYAASFSYSRKFSSTTWGTIVLPVALDYADWSSKFEIAEISGVKTSLSSTGSLNSFTMQQTVLGPGSTTVPNRPYLIRAKTANSQTAQTISKTNCVVYPAEELIVEHISGNYSFQFKGTYSKIVAPNLYGKYYMSGGKWIAAKTTSSMSPMRVYLEISEITVATQPSEEENQETNVEEDNTPKYTAIMKFSDGAEYTGTTTEYAALFSYSRKFTSTTWGTIVLPVALDYEDWSSKFEIAEISGVDVTTTSTGELSSFAVKQTVLGKGSTTVPNRPYLIRAKSANSQTAQTISKTNCIVYPAEDQIVEYIIGDYAFQFKGTYTNISAPNLYGKYIISGGKWIAGKETTTMKPMRVYLEISTSQKAKTREGNDETDFAELEDERTTEAVNVSSRIIGLAPGTYKINGRRINVTK